MAQSEMKLIRAPDIDWMRRQCGDTHSDTEGLFGVWSAGDLDHWVGKDGPMAQAALGGEGGGRVGVLKGVPHAFCLSECGSASCHYSINEVIADEAARAHSELVAETVAKWMAPDQVIVSSTPDADMSASELAKSVPM